MKGFGGGLQQLMKQANQMQMKMKKVQEDLAKLEFSGTSGGGAVTVTVSGDNKVIGFKIDAELMGSGDVEMLQDLLVTATNDALKTAKSHSDQEMQKITGGALPGMF